MVGISAHMHDRLRIVSSCGCMSNTTIRITRQCRIELKVVALLSVREETGLIYAVNAKRESRLQNLAGRAYVVTALIR